MRRTVLAVIAVTAFVASCGQPSEPAGSAPAPSADAASAPVMPADAPPQEEVDPAILTTAPGAPASCVDDIGPAAAQRLVQRCIAVSPATRPPCNVANPCAMTQGEIDRSCEMYAPGEARPAECAA